MQKKLQFSKVIDYFDFKKPSRLLQSTFLILSLFCFSGSLFSQTTLINPATDGGFNSGNTFAANGWTVANEGTGIIKWTVGSAVNSGVITGNSAYVSTDNGATNVYAGVGASRTLFFYRDVVIPAGQTNIALSFNWKSGVNTWQVFAAPTSVTPVGSDAQATFSGFPSVAALTGATPVVLGVTNGTVTQKATGFIPSSFAGSTVRLIFMWSNNTGGTNPPLAIDNISLISRVGAQTVSSIATGNYSDASTWDTGYVPSPTDDVVINTGHTVTIDNRILGVENLFIAGANAIVQYGVDTEEFTINNDLLVSGSGARLNVYNGTNGRSLKVGHNIDLVSGGRLDVSVGSGSIGFGQLDLFGSTVQTISSDGTGIMGGTVISTTTTNTSGIINQLNITNTSSSATNVVWDINNIRIKNALRLNKARVGLGSNKIILGNFATLSTVVSSFGNGFIGGTIARWYTTSATGTAVNPGTDHNPNTNGFFPIVSATGKNRSAYIISSAASTAGELEITYTDASTFGTGLSIADGSYTVTNRYNGNWAITNAGSGGTVYANAAGTFTFGAYASGAYETNDGSSRIIYNAASVAGEHINGTTTPFVSRKGMTLANLMTAPLYVGFNNASVLGTTTITSVASGDWNTASTWSTNAVPVCADVVKIASGHTVTNNAAANVTGITVEFGGTFVNASNNLTVGCSGKNNSIFSNYGTLTVSGGTVTVNGGLSHKLGSTFNQSGGNIIIDSNANGVAANSVGIGGSSLKIETSSLNLTNGTITIVDPLVNNSVATTANSVSSFTVDTHGAAGTFDKGTNAAATMGATTIVMDGFNSNQAIYGVGQFVTGTGIAAGTTVTSVTAGQLSNAPITLGLSLPITAGITAGSTLTFSSMSNGCATINFPSSANAANLAIGQVVTGTGIPAGTTIVSMAYDLNGFGGMKLSNPVSGLPTSPITSVQTLSFSGASVNCSTIILDAANPLIVNGQTVGGPGIQPGTTVGTITGVRLDLSLPTVAGITNPVALNFYDGNLGSFAVSYNSPNHYAAGANHTLQIGDGISIEKAAVTTNGYLCNFAQGGGLLSLGKLTVNALDGTNRFFNTVNTLNVQDTFTITNGSVFKRNVNTGGLFFGGNIVNNGTAFMNNFTQVKLMNSINGADVATTTPQTISGAGVFYNNVSASIATGSVPSLTVNNASAGGVTIATPNFRVSSGLTMTAGVIHTSAATPLYHGLQDLVSTGFLTGNFSDTCFIDGPYVKAIATNGTNTNFILYPVGKTSYKPLSLAVNGGGDFTVEAFDANSGIPSVNIANVSTTRWKVIRNGSLGALTDFNVRLGNAPIASNNIVVQAAADQGTYDVLGTSAFAAGTPNTISTTTAILGANFTGNFAYGTSPNCTTVNPGLTIADLSISQIVHTQKSTNTGIVLGNNVITLTAAANALIVPGLVVSGTGIQAGTTVVSAAGTVLTLSLPATVSSSSQTVLTFSSVQNSSTLCGAQAVTLKLQNTAVGNGVTYQWQSSADGSVYTNISGATAATLVDYPTASLYYQCVVTCPFGPVTVTSTPVQVLFSNNILTAIGGSSCTPGTPVNLGATASSGTVTWYNVPTGGTALATGATYSPSPAVTTTYYVSSETTSGAYTAGRSLTGTLTQTSDFSGLVFNTATNIRLNSVKVHPKQTSAAPQPVTIKLFDKNGVQVPGTTAVTFTPSVNAGAVSAAISDVVALNYDIPAGSGYKLLVTSGLSSANALGRLTSDNSPVGAGSISIVGGLSSFSATPDTQYYNFFDLNITDVCASPRVAVIATITNIPVPTGVATQDACITGTIADFAVTGEIGATFTWYDAAVLGTILPTSTVTVLNTTYYVSQTVNGCEGPRLAIVGQGPCLGDDDFKIRELKYYPNPVTDQLTITAKETITRVELYNLLGQRLKVLEVNADTVQIDFNEFTSSTYLIKLYSEQNVQLFKVIKK